MGLFRFFCLLILSTLVCWPANLQPEDIFFISTHTRGFSVASSPQNGYLATESGILVYDYSKNQWVDSYPGREPITEVVYVDRLNEIRVMMGGRAYEYEPHLRQYFPVDSLFYTPKPVVKNLTGIHLKDGFQHFGSQVRDRYLRITPITGAYNFSYDHLWILTRDFGAFLGSQRHKRAESVWFGFSEPELASIYTHNNRLYFGPARFSASFVRSSKNLSEWRHYPPKYESALPNGRVMDMVSWNDKLWMATGDGVVSYEDDTENFRHYGFFDGLMADEVYDLETHFGDLYAGTEGGLVKISGNNEIAKNIGFPRPGYLRINRLYSMDKELWAATSYGAYLYLSGKWLAPWDTKRTIGYNIVDIVRTDSLLLYARQGTVYYMRPKGKEHVLLDKNRISKLQYVKPHLYIGYQDGVLIYNLENNLRTDMQLADGIPGTEVFTFYQTGDHLWVATEKGASRIYITPYLP